MSNASLSFLDGGGEMGQLTRNYNWAQNTLGRPEGWPQSLKTTVGIVLNSHFPMFLFWGPELICLYNDAYRASLGNNGKHPGALGQPAANIWPETWRVIKPLIDQVMGGGPATWSKDQLIPIYRNGQLEDVYWTFSYSPVRSENGSVSGVLVTCTETTENVKQYNILAETRDQLQFAIDAAELGTWDFNPKTNVFKGNSRLKQWFGLRDDEYIPLPVAIESIAPADRGRVTSAIAHAMDYSSGGKYDITYTIIHPHTGQETVVRGIGQCFFDDNKKAYRFNGILQDITKEVAATHALRESENNLRTLILQAPVAMCVLKGPQFVVEIANDQMVQLWGKTHATTIGRPVFDGLPEARDQGLEALLRHVYDTGEYFYATEMPVVLPRAEGLTPIYQNFVYAPYLGPNGEVAGVIVVTYDVTELTLARKKAEEMEFNAQLAIEVTEIGTYDIDLKQRTIQASPRLNEIYGIAATTDLYEYVKIILPEDLPIRDQAYKVALETDVMFYEARIVHPKTNAIRWIRAKGRVIYENGEPAKLVGAVLDITDQKTKIDILEENEKRMKLLADAMPQLVWIADPEGNTTFYNSRIREYHVRPSATEKSGWEWESMVHEDDAEATAKAWRKSVAEGSTYSIEHRIRMQNGQYRWHLSRGVPDKNANGDIIHWFGTATDIDMIKKTQEGIKESEALFRQLAEDVPMFVWISNPSGHVQYANRELLNYIGAQDRQPIRNMWENVTHPEDIGRIYAMYVSQLENPSPFTLECRFMEAATGKYNWFLFKGVPRYTNLVFKGYIGTAVNIQGFMEFSRELESQVNARTQQLAAANHQLKQTNLELEQFAYVASHDLQEPLRKVRTFAGMLDQTDPAAKTLVEKIDRSTARMSRLIKDVLNFSRLAGSRELFRPTDLAAELANTLSDFELLIAEKKAVVKTDVLPVIDAVPLQINQLFANLTGNALKFNHPGRRPELAVTVKEAGQDALLRHPELDPNKRYCVITFADNGIGFKQEYARQIFNIFQRLHSKDEYSGTGIGLALCKKIVLNHQGSIEATAQQGEGAAFTLILPYHQ